MQFIGNNKIHFSIYCNFLILKNVFWTNKDCLICRAMRIFCLYQNEYSKIHRGRSCAKLGSRISPFLTWRFILASAMQTASFWVALRDVFFKECTVFTNDVKAYISKNLVNNVALLSRCHISVYFQFEEKEGCLSR